MIKTMNIILPYLKLWTLFCHARNYKDGLYLGPNLELMQVDILHFREFRDGQNVGELYIFFEKMLAF